MSFNIVNIKVSTDYTDYSNIVQFQLNVPVTAEDATTLYKALASGDWKSIETDITAAVNKNAPTSIQSVVAALLKAYSGSSGSPPS